MAVGVDRVSADGRVSVKYGTPQAAMAAKTAFQGRWFGGRQVAPSPATHAILARLKAGETVYQAGELP